MEKELLPASRYRGIRLLPSETMVNIMNMVGKYYLLDPVPLKKMMWAFWDVEPFNVYVHSATSLRKAWKACDSIWDGHLPRTDSPSRITKFIFSMRNACTLQEIRDGLRPLKSLEHLDITCEFDHEKVAEGPGHDLEVVLPKLKTLRVSNRNLWETQWVADTESPGWSAHVPLQRIVRMLGMPNLTHITANIFTTEFADTILEIVDIIFDFPARSYPTVKALCLESIIAQAEGAFAHIDLDNAFRSLPALRSLSIGSLDCISFRYDPTPDSKTPSSLRSLRLVYNDMFAPRRCLWGVDKPIHKLLDSGAPLKNIEVVSHYEEVFDDVRKAFPSARWVTDRSILDQSPGDGPRR